MIYQIYPRSFQDSNGDGVGDLPGITRRLDYVAQLGVDAIWISPFCKSPMKDYRLRRRRLPRRRPDVRHAGRLRRAAGRGPRAGPEGDDRLRALATPATSMPGSRRAAQSRDNPKADWYVWADAKPDGTPPNNWLAVFGGSAWEWDSRRGQYYLHNFLKEQPDLNFHNPQVIEALLAPGAVLARARRRRLSASTRSTSASTTRSCATTRRAARRRRRPAAPRARPFAMQDQLWNKARPELIELFLKPLHALTERYRRHGGAGRDQRRRRAAARGRVHQRRRPRHGLQLRPARPAAGTPTGIRGIVERLEKTIGDGWGCWSFCNHDVRRVGHAAGAATTRPRACAGWCRCCWARLRGTVCLYQGEELGLEEAELAFEQLQGPVRHHLLARPSRAATAAARRCRGRRPRREAGFTAGEPWLPIPESHRRRAVDAPGGRPGLAAQHHPRLPQLAPRAPPLRTGELALPAHARATSWPSSAAINDRLLCLFNLGGEPAAYRAVTAAARCRLRQRGRRRTRAATSTLPPWGFAFAHLE